MFIKGKPKALLQNDLENDGQCALVFKHINSKLFDRSINKNQSTIVLPFILLPATYQNTVKFKFELKIK